MTTLIDFLLARIAEDEANAKESENYFPDDGPFLRWDSDRILAECQAKRRIVEHFQHLMEPGEPDISPEYDDGYIDATEYALKVLALPYADHPDYQQEWKP